ncbi:MAG: RNA polymerase sigma factor [Lawsonibacter sp.]|jgi:RNA polymerase sigma-70 factor (ECF subfamily)
MGPALLQQEVEEELLRSYQSLYRLAYTYVKNPDDAMDVVQESAYKAIQNASGVRSSAAIKGWLCRIVANTALDLLRTRAREVPVEEVPESGREDTYQDLDTLRALDRLEDRERLVVVLRFFEDMKLQDIALATGENLNTVKTVLYRSLKKLRVQLSEGESLE